MNSRNSGAGGGWVWGLLAFCGHLVLAIVVVIAILLFIGWFLNVCERLLFQSKVPPARRGSLEIRRRNSKGQFIGCKEAA
jgi:hypothetical protein